MSMVGYVLGLGDRHPSNLMLDRTTGKVLHIDFGDCFEVAMQREKFPEKVPFRLTRMLVNAMEVSGIEGNFRLTCEKVMAILRENEDSVIATLEAFVHDPLVSWRLQDTEKKSSRSSAESAVKVIKDVVASPITSSNDAETTHTVTGGEVPSNFGRSPLTPSATTASAMYNARSRFNSRLKPLPSLPEIEDTVDELDQGLHGGEERHHADKQDLMQQLGVEETSASPERFENLHTEMHQLSSSASGNSLTFSINLKASFSERSFANRRRAMTYSEASDEPTTDKAIAVIRRIQDKLTGLDFVKRTPGDKAGPAEALDVPEQVDKLIRQATSNENLCLSFFGWCPFW
jgi:FKBP12-rapamycin complex-associated protein